MNITKVDTNLYRGPSPKTEDDFKQLKDAGIKYILDLEIGPEFFGDGLPLTQSLCADSYGIRSYSHPLGQVLPPTKQETDLAIDFMIMKQFFGPVYIHCKKGVDRTGFCIGRYRMKVNGWTKAQAVKEMYDMGMSFQLKWWAWFL